MMTRRSFAAVAFALSIIPFAAHAQFGFPHTGQEEFKKINADLSKKWPVIAEKKAAPPDAKQWEGVAEKKKLLET